MFLIILNVIPKSGIFFSPKYQLYKRNLVTLALDSEERNNLIEKWLIGKDTDAGRDWGQEEKGMTEDEMAGWHHWHDGRESDWTPGVGDGQESRAAIHGVAKSGTRLSDWTELNLHEMFPWYL